MRYRGAFSSFHIRIGILSTLILLSWIKIIDLGGDLFQTYTTYQINASIMDTLDNAQMLLVQQQAMLDQLRIRQGYVSSEPAQSHQDFVSYLSQQCENQAVKLISLPMLSTQVQAGMTTEKEAFSLSGGLLSMLKVLHQIEARDQLGRLVSIHFETRRIRRNGGRVMVLVGEGVLERGMNQSK